MQGIFKSRRVSNAKAAQRELRAGHEVAILHEAREPLEQLAGHLATRLKELETFNPQQYPKEKKLTWMGARETNSRPQTRTEWKKGQKTVTTLTPKGKRHPRVSYHKGHLTVSWQGNKEYHNSAWFTPLRKNVIIDYEAKIFFKGTATAPRDWLEVYPDFGGAHQSEGAGQMAWNDIASNHFVIITRNSSAPVRGKETVALAAGVLPGSHFTDYNASLADLEQWKWFAFPGIGHATGVSHAPGSGHTNRHKAILGPAGQLSRWIPDKTISKPFQRRKSLPPGAPLRLKPPHSTSMFAEEYDCALALLSKIYPGEIKIVTQQAIKRGTMDLIDGLSWIAGILVVTAGIFYLVQTVERSDIGQKLERIMDIMKEPLPETNPGDDSDSSKNMEPEDNEVTLPRPRDTPAAGAEKVSSVSSHFPGLDKPPCWYDASGNPEFIYDVYFSDLGLNVARSAPVHRVSDYEALPVEQTFLRQALSTDTFTSSFRPLYNHSVTAGCRHFVGLYNQPPQSDVALYQSQLRAVDGYFYISRMN